MSAPTASHEILRVVVADDERMARQRLERLLSGLPGVELLASCDSGEAALEAASDADVLILDIQMPGLTGLDAAKLLPEPRPYLIFCTAHREHALEAFDAGAVDYLLKPVDAARLRQALERARTRGLAVTEAPVSPASSDPLAIPTRQGIRLLDPRDITHVVLENELVTVFTAQEQLLADASLQELHDKLQPFGFERVHRRALLHLGKVKRLVPLETGGFQAELGPGREVEISRQTARVLRRRLGLRRASEDSEPD